MQLRVVVHEAEEGGFWAEVPALPGCASQGETLDELLFNVREAVEGWLAVDVPPPFPARANACSILRCEEPLRARLRAHC